MKKIYLISILLVLFLASCESEIQNETLEQLNEPNVENTLIENNIQIEEKQEKETTLEPFLELEPNDKQIEEEHTNICPYREFKIGYEKDRFTHQEKFQLNNYEYLFFYQASGVIHTSVKDLTTKTTQTYMIPLDEKTMSEIISITEDVAIKINEKIFLRETDYKLKEEIVINIYEKKEDCEMPLVNSEPIVALICSTSTRGDCVSSPGAPITLELTVGGNININEVSVKINDGETLPSLRQNKNSFYGSYNIPSGTFLSGKQKVEISVKTNLETKKYVKEINILNNNNLILKPFGEDHICDKNGNTHYFEFYEYNNENIVLKHDLTGQKREFKDNSCVDWVLEEGSSPVKICLTSTYKGVYENKIFTAHNGGKNNCYISQTKIPLECIDIKEIKIGNKVTVQGNDYKLVKIYGEPKIVEFEYNNRPIFFTYNQEKEVGSIPFKVNYLSTDSVKVEITDMSCVFSNT